MREAARRDDEGRAKRGGASVRGLVVPLPKDAKLETEYFEKVAVPFYTKWIVDAYRPPAGTKPAVAEQVRTVRRALVRRWRPDDPSFRRTKSLSWRTASGARSAVMRHTDKFEHAVYDTQGRLVGEDVE